MAIAGHRHIHAIIPEVVYDAAVRAKADRTWDDYIAEAVALHEGGIDLGPELMSDLRKDAERRGCSVRELVAWLIGVAIGTVMRHEAEKGDARG